MQHSTSEALSPRSVEPRKRPTGRRVRQAVACVTLAATAALLAGCGGDTAKNTSAEKAAPSSPSKSMDGMGDMAMGDPSATPADKVPGAEVVKGIFALLDTRPPGMDDVKGTAWLAQGAQGTTVTVSLTGLKPGDSYMAHLHAQHCAAGNGGKHFQFEKGGAAAPRTRCT